MSVWQWLANMVVEKKILTHKHYFHLLEYENIAPYNDKQTN